MKYLLAAFIWSHLMYAEAIVTPGNTPGTYHVDQYGAPRERPTPRQSFPKPSRPSIPRR